MSLRRSGRAAAVALWFGAQIGGRGGRRCEPKYCAVVALCRLVGLSGHVCFYALHFCSVFFQLRHFRGAYQGDVTSPLIFLVVTICHCLWAARALGSASVHQ